MIASVSKKVHFQSFALLQKLHYLANRNENNIAINNINNNNS